MIIPPLTLKKWITTLVIALAVSGLLASLLDVGSALASVSWNF